MVEQKDYVDISPKETGGTGQAGRKMTVFNETEKEIIVNNPSGLTKEGVLKKIELWKRSSNRHQQILYQTMLKQCKNLHPSGKYEDGRTILAKDKNGRHWLVGPPPPKKPKVEENKK